MKKLILIILIIFSVSLFSKEYECLKSLEKDVIILLKYKLEIYKTKRELYLLKKTLVVE